METRLRRRQKYLGVTGIQIVVLVIMGLANCGVLGVGGLIVLRGGFAPSPAPVVIGQVTPHQITPSVSATPMPAVPPQSQQVTASNGTFTIPGTAYMDGRDIEAKPPLTLMNINIWDGVQRGRAICTLRHGTNVNLLDAKWSSEESRYYFQVQSNSCKGWVPEWFVNTIYQPPVGDRVP